VQCAHLLDYKDVYQTLDITDTRYWITIEQVCASLSHYKAATVYQHLWWYKCDVKELCC